MLLVSFSVLYFLVVGSAFERSLKLYLVSLMASLLTIMFLQDSVTTCARNGGIFRNRFTANLPRSVRVKNLGKSVKI